MTEGTKTFMGLGVPLLGESEIIQQTAATDILTVTGAGSQSGDFIVCQISDGTEKFVVDVSGNITAAGTLSVTGATSLTGNLSLSGKIAKMVLGTVALASLASNASATVALTGIATNSTVLICGGGARTTPLPVVWASTTDKLGYGAPSVATEAMTVNYWHFTTS